MPEKIYSYTVVFEPLDDGRYLVTVPALPGITTQGDDLEDARKMAADAIQGHLEALALVGEPIPVETSEPAIRTEKIEVPLHVT